MPRILTLYDERKLSAQNKHSRLPSQQNHSRESYPFKSASSHPNFVQSCGLCQFGKPSLVNTFSKSASKSSTNLVSQGEYSTCAVHAGTIRILPVIETISVHWVVWYLVRMHTFWEVGRGRSPPDRGVLPPKVRFARCHQALDLALAVAGFVPADHSFKQM